MGELVFLSRSDVQGLLHTDAVIDALPEAFRALSAGECSVPPRVGAFTPAGALAAMPGYLPKAGLGAKLVSVFAGNAGTGLATHQALIALMDPKTGRPLAVMDGEHITAVRTGAASAVAADLVARPDAAVLAILGAGVQGASHLDAVRRVRDLAEVRVASRIPEHAAALADSHPKAHAVPSFEEAVRGADIVCCCTDAQEAIIDRGWLSAGCHVGSVGVNLELDAETVKSGSVFVEWRGAAASPWPAGAQELQGVEPDTVTELGEVLLGSRPGRMRDDEITVYKSTGHAVEDLAAAALVYARAKEQGVGRRIRV